MLTPVEVGYLQMHFTDLAKLVAQQTFKGSYLHIVNKVRNAIKTSTKFRLRASNCAFSFDGPIPGAYGQGHTTFQFAYRNSSIFCAKIGSSATLEREKSIADVLFADGNVYPTVMPVVDFIDVGNSRFALITPYYPVSLSQVVGALDDDQLTNVALCTVASIRAFSEHGLCHGDIKPSNLMFSNNKDLVVTIDFGSAGKFGTFPTGGSTLLYGLDAECMSRTYDQICLAVSLAELKWGSFDDGIFANIATVGGFSTAVNAQPDDRTKHIIRALLTSSIDAVWEYLLALEGVKGLADMKI